MSVANLLNFEDKRIVWVDMEMTGLDIDKDKIMELALLVTDSNLNILAEGPNIIIHQPLEVLESMNEWCINTHTKNGLTESCLQSKVTICEAEVASLKFLSKYVNKQCTPLAGNSVYNDKIFLQKFMPELSDFLHYRIIDVSTVKELCLRWNPKLYNVLPKKGNSHRALQDIRESVNELIFYKTNFFRSNADFDDAL